MMPQTPEHIFALLGSQPGAMEAFNQPRMNVPRAEVPIHNSPHLDPPVEEAPVQQEQQPEEENKQQQEEEYNQEAATDTSVEEVEVDSKAAVRGKQDHRPEHNDEYADDDIYQVLGVETTEKEESALTKSILKRRMIWSLK
jgi:hypothetical protein